MKSHAIVRRFLRRPVVDSAIARLHHGIEGLKRMQATARERHARRTTDDKWLVVSKPNPHARLRIFCLPYAGGSASIFAPWAARLPADIELCAVQLPGRANRLADPPYRNVADLISALGPAIAPWVDKPYALFGHSLGAILAFELARWMRSHGHTAPAHLFVGARRAVDLPADTTTLHAESDQTFIGFIAALNGTPAEALEDQELLRLALPSLRADVELVETYVHAAAAPLACPITAIRGLDDDETTGARVDAWRKHTNGAFDVVTLPGGHFFLHAQERALLQLLTRALPPPRH